MVSRIVEEAHMKKLFLVSMAALLVPMGASMHAQAGKTGDGPQVKASGLRQGGASEVRPGKGPTQEAPEEEENEALPRGRGVAGSAPIEPVPPGESPPKDQAADEVVAPADRDTASRAMKNLGPQPEPPEKIRRNASGK